MTYKGIIIKHTGTTNTIRIQVNREACTGCSTCSSRQAKCDQGIDITVPCCRACSVGNTVMVDMDLPGELLPAFIVFGLPLLGLLTGGFAGYRLAPAADAGIIWGCLLGLACGFILAAVAERKLPQVQPRVHTITALHPSHEEPHAQP